MLLSDELIFTVLDEVELLDSCALGDSALDDILLLDREALGIVRLPLANTIRLKMIVVVVIMLMDARYRAL